MRLNQFLWQKPWCIKLYRVFLEWLMVLSEPQLLQGHQCILTKTMGNTPQSQLSQRQVQTRSQQRMLDNIKVIIGSITFYTTRCVCRKNGPKRMKPFMVLLWCNTKKLEKQSVKCLFLFIYLNSGCKNLISTVNKNWQKDWKQIIWTLLIIWSELSEIRDQRSEIGHKYLNIRVFWTEDVLLT